MNKKYTPVLVVICIVAIIFWIDGTVLCLITSIVLLAIAALSFSYWLKKCTPENSLLILMIGVLFFLPFYERHIAKYNLKDLDDGKVYMVYKVEKDHYPYAKIQELDGWHRFSLEIPLGEKFKEGDGFYVIKGKIIRVTEK